MKANTQFQHLCFFPKSVTQLMVFEFCNHVVLHIMAHTESWDKNCVQKSHSWNYLKHTHWATCLLRHIQITRDRAPSVWSVIHVMGFNVKTVSHWWIWHTCSQALTVCYHTGCEQIWIHFNIVLTVKYKTHFISRLNISFYVWHYIVKKQS